MNEVSRKMMDTKVMKIPFEKMEVHICCEMSVSSLDLGFSSMCFGSGGSPLKASAAKVFLNNFNKFNVRVEETTLLHHIGKNKGFIRVVILIFLIQIVLVYFGGLMFRTIPLTWTEWAIVLLISFLIIPFDIARKRLLKSGI